MDEIRFSVTVYKSGRGFNVPKEKCKDLQISGGDSVHLVISQDTREIYSGRKTLKSGTEIYGSDLARILNPKSRIGVTASAPIRTQKPLENSAFVAQESASGYQADSKIRREVEACAMAKDKVELEARNYINIEDKSSTESFDFTCRKDGTTYYVEVKGTQGEGESVILTAGEVRHAQKFPECSIIIIVSHIQIDTNGKASLTTRHRVRFLCPWNPQKVDLTVLQYRWDVPMI